MRAAIAVRGAAGKRLTYATTHSAEDLRRQGNWNCRYVVDEASASDDAGLDSVI